MTGSFLLNKPVARRPRMEGERAIHLGIVAAIDYNRMQERFELLIMNAKGELATYEADDVVVEPHCWPEFKPGMQSS